MIVIERTGVASAASGRSGGFLARDWCDGTALEPLARRSFELHASLADGTYGDWGYRRLTTYGGFAGPRNIPRLDAGGPVSWLGDAVVVDRHLGSIETTAQVHPGAFTAGMMRAAQAYGAELRVGEVTGLAATEDGGHIEGVEVDSEIIAADAVIIAMGPWSILASQWLPLPAVFGLKGHSVIFETGATIPAQAVFLEYQEATGALQSPEIFPRADGTTYVCAISSESPLPVNPTNVEPDPGAIERLLAICSEVSPALAKAPVLARQACYRPVTRDGLPLIGAVPGVQGAYVATGHSVWGILNAPATGEAIADLIFDGGSHAIDLSPFDPTRSSAI